MSKSINAIAAVTCSGLVALGLLVAPAASAYPPGKQQKTELNKSEIREGGRFKAVVVNAQPGCRVSFTIRNANGREVAKRTGTIGNKGRAQREFSGDTPTKPGTYTVETLVSGPGCARASSSATFSVR